MASNGYDTSPKSNMEQQLWRETEEKLSTTLAAGENNNNHSLSLQTLSSLRSLIINPSTSDLTISSILKTLTLISSLSLHHHHHHHIFSLLAAISLHRPTLSLQVSTALLSLSSSLLSDSASSPRFVAAALSALLSVSSAIDDDDSIDDGLLVSLCFRPCVSVRVWFLKNALRFRIRPNLLLTVLLGFTKDPYPCVRQAALDGLVRVCQSGVEVDDDGITEGCYFRSVELLQDREDYVRKAAVCSVSEWGRMLAATKEEGDKRGWSDAVFLQICAMVRDMNVGVRVEAFSCLGKIAFVSEDMLLQSLSKKLLGTTKEKQSLAPCRARPYEIHASSAAGVFIHGLEDEYNEVQRAACISLRMLTVLSGRFASEAVNLLTCVLNDDSMIVRLEALKTVHHMATSGCLKMQEEHVDMVLGTLVDNHPDIRSTALNILGSVKLPDLQVSKLTVQSLLRSLSIHSQSEAAIFRTLFSIGQNHGNHAVRIVEEFYHEIEPFGDWKLDGSNTRVAGLLVLAISVSLKHEKYSHRISPRIFAYAAAFFGRISHALRDVLDKDSLSAHLSHCGDWASEVESKSGPKPGALPATEGQPEAFAYVLSSVKFILVTVKNFWQLVKSGCTSEVLKALRCCKESLWTMRADSLEHKSAVRFAFEYIRVVKLLTKIWGHFLIPRKRHLSQIGDVHILLQKLDNVLLALRYRFIGLTEEDELYILELLLLSYVLALSSSHINCKTLKKLSTTITSMNSLSCKKSIASSEFVNQLAELSSRGIFSHNEVPQNYPQLKTLAETFAFKDCSLTPTIKHISAELVVQGYDSVSPLRFISGFPVGIPLEITLYNVRNEHRLWVKMISDQGIIEYIYVDMEFGSAEEVRHFVFTSPFYRTPKAVAFTLRVSIGMECIPGDLCLVKGHGGPKHSLVYLCPEKEVYFVSTKSL